MKHMKPMTTVRGCLLTLTLIGAFALGYAIFGKIAEDLAIHDRLINTVPEIRAHGLGDKVRDALLVDRRNSIQRVFLGLLGASVFGTAFLGLIASDRNRKAEQRAGERTS